MEYRSYSRMSLSERHALQRYMERMQEAYDQMLNHLFWQYSQGIPARDFTWEDND